MSVALPDKVRARAGLARWLVALALGLGSAGVAWAHAQLLASVPADGQVLASAPKLVQLRFNESLEPSFSRVVVAGADGKPVATGKLRLTDGDTRSAEVPLDALPSGRYSVQWSAMGRDGHRMKGSFHFEVK